MRLPVRPRALPQDVTVLVILIITLVILRAQGSEVIAGGTALACLCRAVRTHAHPRRRSM